MILSLRGNCGDTISRHVFRHSRFYSFAMVVLLAIGLYTGWLFATRNFHEVIAGELYRSAQLRPVDIKKYAGAYHIRSIINLRGANPDAKWYRDEVAEAARLGITHIDFAISSRKMVTRAESLQLIALMRNAPKPLLIHCEAGANRTSLATALYLAAIKKRNEFESELQLSLIYGHVPLWFLRPFAMDRSFDVMEDDFGYSKS